MLKKYVALSGLAVALFAGSTQAANVTLMEAWRSLGPSESTQLVADDCSPAIRFCEWQSSDARVGGDDWTLVADREVVDVYQSDVNGRYAVVLTRPPQTVVPLPAAGWMFMSALAGLGLVARKRSASK